MNDDKKQDEKRPKFAPSYCCGPYPKPEPQPVPPRPPKQKWCPCGKPHKKPCNCCPPPRGRSCDPCGCGSCCNEIITKFVIPASLGDDLPGSEYAPKNGAYRNALVEYEATGAVYFYTSDGIFTKLGYSVDEKEAASIGYVDEAMRRAVDDANDYSDDAADEAIRVAEGYADAQDAITLQSAKDYADGKDAATLSSAKSYADGVGAQALLDAKAYTDSAASSVVTKTYVDTGDQNTLDTATSRISTAKGEVIDQIETLENSLATVATTGDYSDLLNAPSIPVIDMVPSADDPGEGAALAANHFIGVYN